MSREILFRGQMRKKGEKVNLADEPLEGIWIYGGIFAASSNSDRCIITSYDDLKKYPVHADTVGQYTGLKDRNGKKIFEGDILRGKGKNVYEVVYPENIAGFVTRGTGVLSVPCMNYGTMKYYEIIGNIYDNPELLGDYE